MPICRNLATPFDISVESLPLKGLHTFEGGATTFAAGGYILQTRHFSLHREWRCAPPCSNLLLSRDFAPDKFFGGGRKGGLMRTGAPKRSVELRAKTADLLAALAVNVLLAVERSSSIERGCTCRSRSQTTPAGNAPTARRS
jgi:hypothetical protein